MLTLRGSLAAAALVAAGIAAPAAQADVKSGRLIENFHGINYVGIDGYPAREDVRVEVVRNGVVIGHATKRTDATGFFELNHVGGDDCFDTPTPDILPGDVIRTKVLDDPTDVDSSIVRDVFRTEPEVVTTVEDDLLTAEDETVKVIRVTGHVREPGTTTPLDNVEIRLNHPGGTWDADGAGGRSDWRENATIAVDGSFSVDFTGASADDLDAVSAAEVGAEWGNPGLTEITVYDGLADGACGPATTTAITDVTPGVVNAAHSGEVVVSGLYDADGVTSVRVGRVVDEAGVEVDPGVEATLTGGVWRAVVPVGARPDGLVHLRVEYAGATAPAAQTATVTKDTVAPGAVTADLAAGTYASAQTVHLSGEGEIRYTTDGSTPTATSQKYNGPVSVTADRTIKAMAIDAAGNHGPVSDFAYVIQPPKPVIEPPVVIEKVVPVETIREVVVLQPPVVTPVAPVAPLKVGAVSRRASYKLAAARKGIEMRLAQVGTGLKAVLDKGGKVTVARRGASYVLKLKVARKGTYRLTLTPRGGAAVSKTISFKVV